MILNCLMCSTIFKSNLSSKKGNFDLYSFRMSQKYLLICLLSLFICSQSRAQVFYEGAGWTQFGELSYTALGWSMSNAGDVNGDGYDDMIITAIDYSNPEETNGEEGKVYLYYGSATGLEPEAAWQYETDNDSSVLGFSSDGGDLNGDGYSDIAVGCLQWTNGEYNEGSVFLWYGSATGLTAGPPDWTIEFDQVFALLGSGVALGGDINNDGFNDLFISAKMWDEPEIEEGKTWLYWGSAAGPVESGWSWQADQAGAISGFPVNYAGDVNSDGFDDVIIGANQYNYIDIDDGLAVTFYGSAAGLNESPDWMVSSGQKKCNFGHWVDGAGDVNGDGFDDVVVAALLYESDTATGNEGRIFVYHGSADGLETEVAWFGEINQYQAQFGYSCAGAGDINNDGYADVIGGSKYYDNGSLDEGAAFVWFGGPDGLELNYCWSGEGNQDNGYYGRHVGGDGDYNNDGYSDIMVGAYRYTEVLEADGKGFVYYGAPRESDFHFEEDTFCMEEENPFAIVDGLSGGIFYSDDAMVDAITGEINLMATGAGEFIIQYTAPGDCSVSRKIWIEDNSYINVFEFTEDTFCIDDVNPIPIIDLIIAGEFYSEAEVNSLTGEIDLATSGEGNYTIYFSGVSETGCVILDSAEIFIQADVDATFEYGSTVYYTDDPDPSPIIFGDTGIFSSSPDGLLFADEFGTLALSSTLPGIYLITHFLSDSTCEDSHEFTVEILPECSAPEVIYITNLTDSSFTAEWSGDDNYDDYTIYLISGSDTSFYSTTDTSYTFSDLDPGTLYTVFITINCSDSVSENSMDKDVTTIFVGVENNVGEIKINIYPNPATDQLFVNIVGADNVYQLNLISINGNLVYTTLLAPVKQHKISLDQIASGVYFLSLTSDMESGVIKVVVYKK